MSYLWARGLQNKQRWEIKLFSNKNSLYHYRRKVYTSAGDKRRFPKKSNGRRWHVSGTCSFIIIIVIVIIHPPVASRAEISLPAIKKGLLAWLFLFFSNVNIAVRSLMLKCFALNISSTLFKLWIKIYS